MGKNSHLGIIVDDELHYKLHYIAKYEGRSANRQLLNLVRNFVKEFEDKNGKIDVDKLKPPEK